MKEVIELADEVLEAWGDRIDTHYETCWKYHVGCFAALVKNVLTHDATEAP